MEDWAICLWSQTKPIHLPVQYPLSLSIFTECFPLEISSRLKEIFPQNTAIFLLCCKLSLWGSCLLACRRTTQCTRWKASSGDRLVTAVTDLPPLSSAPEHPLGDSFFRSLLLHKSSFIFFAGGSIWHGETGSAEKALFSLLTLFWHLIMGALKEKSWSITRDKLASLKDLLAIQARGLLSHFVTFLLTNTLQGCTDIADSHKLQQHSRCSDKLYKEQKSLQGLFYLRLV